MRPVDVGPNAEISVARAELARAIRESYPSEETLGRFFAYCLGELPDDQRGELEREFKEGTDLKKTLAVLGRAQEARNRIRGEEPPHDEERIEAQAERLKVVAALHGS